MPFDASTLMQRFFPGMQPSSALRVGCLMSDEPLISVAEAAREIGLNRSTLSRQVNAGRIRSHDGQVRLSEVLADRKAKIACSVGGQRERSTAALAAMLRNREAIIDEMTQALNRIDSADDAFSVGIFLLAWCSNMAIGDDDDDDDDASWTFEEGESVLMNTVANTIGAVRKLISQQVKTQRARMRATVALPADHQARD
jgi:transposase-like protein